MHFLAKRLFWNSQRLWGESKKSVIKKRWIEAMTAACLCAVRSAVNPFTPLRYNLDTNK